MKDQLETSSNAAARPRPALLLALAALLPAFAWASLPAAASAAESCALYASTNGSDSAPGTASQPLETAQAMVDRMSPGDVGCLVPGGTFDADPEVRIDKPNVTLTTAPDASRQARLRARIFITKNSDGTTIENLWVNNDTTRNHSLTINGDDVTLRDNEITSSHASICIIVGNSDPQWGRAHRTLITGNRIHDCGTLPATNFEHGIYVSAADDTRIIGNWIYDNADRGVQMYADADHTVIKGNVIDGNGEGVLFAGGDDSNSENNLVANNVITNSRLRDNIESSWGAAGPGSGNVARDNCVSGGAYDDGSGGILEGIVSKLGFRAIDNLLVDPLYVDRGAKNFELRPDSPCAAILAGEDAPPAGSGGGGSKGGARVKVKVNRKAVSSGRRIQVKGKAPGARKVRILRKTRRGWRKLAPAGVRHGSRFRKRVRLAGRGRVKLKAAAGGLRDSRVVRVRVR